MNKERMKLLGEEPVSKALKSLSVPAIIGMLVNAIYSAADTIFVGMVGTQAIGAVSLSFSVMMLLNTIGLTLGLGSASYISRALGEKNYDNANKAANMALLSALICGLILTSLGYMHMDIIVKIIGASESIRPYAIQYLSVIIFGSIFIISNMTMNNIIRAEGNSKFSMIAMASGALLNIALDALLIINFNMGVRGAAIATTFSQIITFIILGTHILRGNSMLKIGFKYLKYDKSIYFDILKIGTPTFIRQIITTIAMIIMNTKAAYYGDSLVAAIGITNRTLIMGMYVVFGIGHGFQPLAGFNYGAKNYSRLKEVIHVTVKWASMFTTAISIIFALFAPYIIGLFTSDPEVLSLGVYVLRVMCILFPLFGFQIIYSILFQSMGKAREASILALARQGLFFIPALIILPRIFSMNGLIFAQTVADFFTIIVTAYLAIKGSKELNGLKDRKCKEIMEI